MGTKKEVLEEHLPRYLKAPRKEKKKILDHLEAVLNMHRKAVIRALKREQLRNPEKPPKKRGRKLLYGPGVTAALRECWEIAGEICAERLKPILGEYVRILKRDTMWSHRENDTVLLERMSLGTMKNRIRVFEKAKAGGGRSTTKPSNLKELIPIRRGPWQNPEPGYGEIDTVAHCGSTLLGSFCYSVNLTDIATTWTESAAQRDKGQMRTQESIERMKERLPFPLKGLDPDSGSEFINWHLKEWCEARGVELTRSRPNHKNDNAHIEQKNYAGIRKFVGYSRIDRDYAIALLDKLYAGPLRLYINFFQPSMQCLEKIRIGSRYMRKYDMPQTPYQRVLVHAQITQSVKDELAKIYATLNPKVLRKEIDRLILEILKIQRQSNTIVR